MNIEETNPKFAYLDIETYSEVNLSKHGVTPYARHPSFKVLCGCILSDNFKYMFRGEPKDNYRDLRKTVNELKKEGYIIVSHNARFESTCLNLSGLWCSAVHSRMITGASKLRDCAIIYLKEDIKNEEGWKNTLLCDVPYDEYKDKPHFKDLTAYCLEDVIITQRIHKVLLSMYDWTDFKNECMVYQDDSTTTNNNGIPVDTTYLKNFDEIRMKLIPRTKKFFEKIEVNPNSHKQVKEFVENNFGLDKFWITEWKKNSKGMKEEVTRLSFSRNVVARLIPLMEGSEKEFFLNKLLSVSSTLKKAGRFLERQYEGRMYDTTVHYGTTTGRQISFTSNPLNMPRGQRDDLINSPKDFLSLELKDAIPRLKSAFRGCIKAPEGSTLLIADLNQIEPRLVSYAIKNKNQLDNYKNGISLYEGMSERLFGKKYPDVYDTLKTGCMAFLYGVGDNRLKQILKSAGRYIGESLSEAKLDNIVLKLKGEYDGISEFEDRLQIKFLTAPSKTKRSLVCIDNEFGDCLFLCRTVIKGVPYLTKYHNGHLIDVPVDQITFRADVTQFRASVIHKYLKHLVIKNGLKVILDAHDELVFEVSKDKVQEAKEIYSKQFEKLQERFSKIPLSYSMKQSEAYLK